MAIKKKVVLLGDSSVGKTSLVRRYVFDQFDDSYVSTVGSKVSRKDITIPRNGESADLTLLIWDLIGEEGYEAFHAWSFAGVHGAILVCDRTRRETLRSWERYWIPALEKVVSDVPMVFLGNKSDLERRLEVDARAIGRVAAKRPAPIPRLPDGLSTHYLSSAKTGENIPEAFVTLGHLMLAERAPRDPFQDLFERVVAMGLSRSADKTTALGVLDSVIVDFAERSRDEFDEKVAMMLLRREIARAGVEPKRPSVAGVRRLIECLAEAEGEYLDLGAVAQNRDRRLAWINGVAR